MESVLLDVAGHRRSPATMPGHHRGRPPRNKGEHYPADPPTVEEIVAVMRTVGDRADGHRLRALIVLLWRAGLRISEALALQESDLDRSRGAILVRRGKGGKRREVGMDRLPLGALLCVIHGPTAGRRWEASAALKQLHYAAAVAGVRRRFAPHQLRHAHAVEMAHEGVPLVVIQRQLGHANLGITSVYLQGIDLDQHFQEELDQRIRTRSPGTSPAAAVRELVLDAVEGIRSVPADQWHGELGYLAAISPTVHRIALEMSDRQANAIATAIRESSTTTPEIAKLQGIALAGVFQIIITEAGQRTLNGQSQDQIADELRPATEAVLDDLDRWLAPGAN